MNTIVGVALSLSSLLALQEPAREASTTVRQAVDLSGLCAALEPSVHWHCLWSPLAEPRWTVQESMDAPRVGNGAEDPADVARFLPEELERLALAASASPLKLELVRKRTELTLLANDAGRASFERTVDLVERWATRRWSVELIDLPTGAAAALDSALLTASEVEALLAAHPPRASAVCVATPRRAARFEELRNESYVYDYDVEWVRASQLAPDPDIGVARWGRDTLVRIHSRSPGSTFVDVETWGGEPDGPARRLRPYVDQSVELELKRGTMFQGVGSGVVPDGGALVLAPCAADGGVLLVRVTHVGAGIDEQGTAALGLGGLSRGSSMSAAHRLPGPSPSGGEQPSFDSLYGYTEDDESPPAPYEPDDLLHEVREEWSARGLRGAVTRLGGEVLAVGERAALTLLRERVRAAQRSRERTFSIDLRFGAVPAALAGGLLAGSPLPAGKSSELLIALGGGRRFLGTATAGSGVTWTAARELQYLQDLDMEISMGGASLPDPISVTAVFGTSAACRVLPMQGDRLLLSLELRRHTLHEPLRSVLAHVAMPSDPAGGGLVMANVELPSGDVHDVALNLPVHAGAWSVVALATRGATAEVVLVRVSEATMPW